MWYWSISHWAEKHNLNSQIRQPYSREVKVRWLWSLGDAAVGGHYCAIPIGAPNRIGSITNKAVAMQQGLRAYGDRPAGAIDAGDRGADCGSSGINPGDQATAVHQKNVRVAADPVRRVAGRQQLVGAGLRKLNINRGLFSSSDDHRRCLHREAG